MDYEKTFAGFFDELGEAARKIALQYFRTVLPVEDKPDTSPVTQADREIEKTLRQMINKKFPDHGIIGEEFGRENEKADFVWVIDPIDGTKSFITGRPLFGTLVGLMHNGTPTVGMIDQPYTKERWFGIDKQFARHNGKPIKVAAPRKLDQARLYTGSISMFKGEKFENFLKLSNTAKLAQQGCDCYVYGLVALGTVDITVEQCLGLYDVAGSAPIITGAGGYVAQWDGKPISFDFNKTCVTASNEALAHEAMAIMNSR